MTISCTQILREGERPEYRYPPRPADRLRRPRSAVGTGETLGLVPKAPQLVTEEVERHRSRHGQGLSGYLGESRGLHEQHQDQQAETQRHETHDDEADGLKVDPSIAGVERPVTVE